MDLRDLWRPGTGITVRWVIVHLKELPDDSRVKKHLAGDEGVFGVTDHLLADVRDLLNMTQYLSGIAATKELKPNQIQKVVRGAPKRIRRPGEPETEIRFATPEELRMLFPKKAAARRIQQRG